MASAVIELDVRPLASVERLFDRIANFDRSELLEDVGAVHESQVRRRITDEKTSPDGQPWQKWSDSYAETRPAGKSLLQSEGALLDDIRYFVEGDSAYVGASLVYARTHQEGDASRNIPARQYMGTSEENLADIREELIAFFEDLIQ